MGMLSTVQCGEMVERLKWLHQTTLENGLKQWLQRELAGYADLDPLPWYRIVECRQRGLFQNIRSGKQQTCQINEQTLSFIPKLLGMLLTLILAGPWMLQMMVDYIRRLFESIPQIIG